MVWKSVCLAAGLTQNPFAYWQDEATFFGNGDEFDGLDDAPCRVSPADEASTPFVAPVWVQNNGWKSKEN